MRHNETTQSDSNEQSFVNEKPSENLLKGAGALKKGETTAGNWLSRFWKATTTPYIPNVEITHGFDLQLSKK